MPDTADGAKFKPSYDYKSAPGVVVDKLTGLIWQRDLPETYSGCTGNQLMEGDTCTAEEAAGYCGRLQLQGERWHLPSKIELESLVDNQAQGVGRALIDRDAFPNTPSELFWTSSPYLGTAGFMWNLSFLTGYNNYQDMGAPMKVRCVRSVITRPGKPADRYSVDADKDTIADMRTQLTWQRTVEVKEIAWADAAAYCSKAGRRFPGADAERAAHARRSSACRSEHRSAVSNARVRLVVLGFESRSNCKPQIRPCSSRSGPR